MITVASFPSPTQNVLEIGPLTIHFYGILIAIGVIVAIIVSRNRYVRFGGSGELFERIAIWGVVVGFLGARVAYVVTHAARFEGRPWAALYIWEGGLAIYGGLIFGALIFIYLLNRWGGDAFAIGDAVAIGIPLAQAIGRWGNYFNQELFGTPSDLPWAVEIGERQAAAAGYPGVSTFHPTFLYESLWNLLILIPVILWFERKAKLAKGASLGLYVALYALVRFFMELLRTDTTFRFLGLSRNGWVSVGAFLFGVGWIVYTQRRAEKRTLISEATFFSPQPQESGSGADDRGQITEDSLEEGPAEDAYSMTKDPGDDASVANPGSEVEEDGT